jgi:hypothetical protein
MSNIQVVKVFEICIVRLQFFNVWSFFVNNVKEALHFWILRLLFLLHGGLFLQKGLYKNVDAMKLINNVFLLLKNMLEKIAHVECVFWKKKLFFIKWGIMKNSTLNAQQQMCSTMFRSKCLLHSCVNDVFYIRIKKNWHKRHSLMVSKHYIF